MPISKNDFLNSLFIITPFKGKKIKLLYETINSLQKNNYFLFINHIVIYDKSSKKSIDFLLKSNKLSFHNNFYNLKHKEQSSKGIYSAINEGLDLVPKKSYYLVLGAGDKIINRSGPILQSKEKIIFFPYALSNSFDKNLILNLRSIYSGMPYCHNAICFTNDGSRYDIRYKISADYDHFLNYLKRHKLNTYNIMDNLQLNISIEFESSLGISSKSFFVKNIENIIIIYRGFGITKTFLYFWHTFKRIIKKVWNMKK